ncbi:hypothetical protein GE21DRAFT_1239523 [Neurospora crassa]|nr:hypothetical protein B14D6.490 [imported] - Neurospora crassa [Neurospora crassa]KHE81944.1 hypothetical protein GE21DRAFT_1239523 [Neurospora crassa]
MQNIQLGGGGRGGGIEAAGRDGLAGDSPSSLCCCRVSFVGSLLSLGRSLAGVGSRAAQWIGAGWMDGRTGQLVQAGPGGWTFQTALVGCPAKLALAGLCGFLLFGNVSGSLPLGVLT